MYKLLPLAILLPILIYTHPTLADSWWEKAKTLVQQPSDTKTDKESAISLNEIEQAFRQALSFGADTVVNQLGQQDGFNADPNIHIPLPSQLASAAKMLDKIGLGMLTQDLELKLNRAAELATPKAKQIFKDAIGQMKIEDVQAIYQGPDDAATQYFKRTMTAPLEAQMRPIIEDSLSKVGAVAAYNEFSSSYKDIPFVPDLSTDLTNHVLELGIGGIFLYLAKEEAKIRNEPEKQVTQLLQKVFSQ